MVTDDEILAAYRELASTQGVFCEPASAASVAGIIKMAGLGRVPSDATVVCVLTGHGLKDPERAEKVFARPGLDHRGGADDVSGDEGPGLVDRPRRGRAAEQRSCPRSHPPSARKFHGRHLRRIANRLVPSGSAGQWRLFLIALRTASRPG